MRTNREIIQVLNQLKNEQNLSLSELARRVGMAKSGLSRYFNYTREFPLNRVDEFAKALNTTSEYILGLDSDAPSVSVENSVNEIIKRRRNDLNLTQDELAKLCSVSTSTIRKWESGDLDQMKRDKMALLAKALEISPLALLGLDDFDLEFAPTSKKETSSDRLTVYGKVCAGDGLEAFEDPIDEINNPYPHLKGEFFSLQVQGDSMNKVVNDGLYAIIKKSPVVNNGEIAVVLIDHEIGMLKRFYRLDDMVILRPDSTNPEHKPLTFIGEQINEIKILGKFVGFVSPFMD